MEATKLMPRGVNPKLTEQYLLTVNDVVDASVWWHDGELRACVAVDEENSFSERDFKQMCLSELGVHQTPRAITLMESRRTRTFASAIKGRAVTTLRAA